MDRRNLLLIVMSIFMLGLQTTAHATPRTIYSPSGPVNLSRSYDRDRNECWQIRSQWRCEDTRGCEWNHWQDRCERRDRDDDNDHYRSCYQIQSPERCSYRSDCYWSPRHGCVDNNNGGGDHPRNCYHIDSQRRCENTLGCQWSRQFDRCLSENH